MGPSMFASTQLGASSGAFPGLDVPIKSMLPFWVAALAVPAVVALISRGAESTERRAQPWPSDGLRGLAARAQPVKLRGATLPSSVWRAHSRWHDGDYLERTLEPLHGVWERPPPAADAKRPSDRSFMYFAHRGANFGLRAPLDAPPASSVVVEHERMSYASFRRRAAEGALLYCSHELDVLGAAALADATPLEAFDLGHNSTAAAATKGILWLGAGRPVAHAHYDTSHNLFVQLVGRKRFALWPPTALTAALSLYPSRHSLHRQSSLRAPVEEMAAAAAAGAAAGTAAGAADGARATVEATVVTLRPREALYLPPYWAHHVAALDDLSISIAVWSDSEAMRRKDALETLPLPWEAHWAPTEVTLAAALYARRVVIGAFEEEDDANHDAHHAAHHDAAGAATDAAAGAATDGASARAIVARLLQSRYEPLRRAEDRAEMDGLLLTKLRPLPLENAVSGADVASGAVSSADAITGAQRAQEGDASAAGNERHNQLPNLGEAPEALLAPLRAACANWSVSGMRRRAELWDHVSAHARRTAAAVRAVASDPAICEVALGDYLEALAAFVTPSRGAIHGFLSICVLGDRPWERWPAIAG